MTYGPPDTSKWPALDFNDEYAAGQAYQRLTMLMRYDPFVNMLDRAVGV